MLCVGSCALSNEWLIQRHLHKEENAPQTSRNVHSGVWDCSNTVLYCTTIWCHTVLARKWPCSVQLVELCDVRPFHNWRAYTWNHAFVRILRSIWGVQRVQTHEKSEIEHVLFFSALYACMVGRTEQGVLENPFFRTPWCRAHAVSLFYLITEKSVYTGNCCLSRWPRVLEKLWKVVRL